MPQAVHGYTIFRLDEHDNRRLITERGWDSYSRPGTIARLDRLDQEYKEANTGRSKYSPRGR